MRKWETSFALLKSSLCETLVLLKTNLCFKVKREFLLLNFRTILRIQLLLVLIFPCKVYNNLYLILCSLFNLFRRNYKIARSKSIIPLTCILSCKFIRKNCHIGHLQFGVILLLTAPGYYSKKYGTYFQSVL